MRLGTFERTLIGVVLVLGVSAWAQEPATANRLTWKTDLRQFGYQRFSRQSVKFMRLAVDFSDERHVAVAWTSPDASKLSERRAPRLGDPGHLHVVVLDARTGRKISQKDWSAGYVQSPLLLGIPNGQFLICTGDSLRFVSLTLDLVQEQELPSHGSCSSTIALLSPSRRTLLLSIRGEQAYYQELLNVDTLTLLSAWTETRWAHSDQLTAFSDNWMATYCGEPREICVRRSSQGDWRPLRSEGLDTRMAKGWHVPARFLSDELLAIEQNDTTVATVRGDVLFQIESPKGHFLFTEIPSAGGERFAATEGQFRGLTSGPLDMYPFLSDDRVLVYSIKDRRAIFSLKLNGTSPWTPWDTHVNSVALPPNGTSLAVLSDTLLTVYVLSDDTADRH
jgi:hypothetical protein